MMRSTILAVLICAAPASAQSRDELWQALSAEHSRVYEVLQQEEVRPDSEYLPSLQRQLAMWQEMIRLDMERLELLTQGEELYGHIALNIRDANKIPEHLQREIARKREYLAQHGAEERPACFQLADMAATPFTPDPAAQGNDVEQYRLRVRMCMAGMPVHYPHALARARGYYPALEFDADNPASDFQTSARAIRQGLIDAGILAVTRATEIVPESVASVPVPLETDTPVHTSATIGPVGASSAPAVPSAPITAPVGLQSPARESNIAKTQRGVAGIFTVLITFALGIIFVGMITSVLRWIGNLLFGSGAKARVSAAARGTETSSPFDDTRNEDSKEGAGATHQARTAQDENVGPLSWWRVLLIRWLAGAPSGSRL